MTSRRELIERAQRVVLLAICLGGPLFFLKGFLDPYNVPKLALLYLGTGIAAALMLARWAAGGDPPRLPRRMLIPAAALVVPLTIAWAFSPYRQWALTGEYPRFQGLIPYVVAGLFLVVLYDAFHADPLPLAWSLAASGAVVGLYGLVQMLGLDPFPFEGVAEVGQGPPSTIGHSNFTGGFLAVALPVAVYLWARRDRWRYAAMACTILVAEGLILSNSQGGWAAGVAGVALVVGAVAERNRPGALRVGRVVAALAAVATVGIVLATMVKGDLPLIPASVETRGDHWKTAVQLAAESPIVGRGPNAYAIEGLRFRSIEEVALTQAQGVNDPHSVPLAFLANAGLLGPAGFALLAAWIIARGRSLQPSDLLGQAMFAASIAWLIDSLVSIDEPALRVARCIALAGLAAAALPSPAPKPRPVPTAGRIALGVTTLAVVGLSVWGATIWVAADRAAQAGRQAFLDGRVERGVERLDTALSLRFDTHYRSLLGDLLGASALDMGAEGAPLIDRMRRAYDFLDDVPESEELFTEAHWLHHWGRFDPGADAEALTLFRRGLRFDPTNVIARVEVSEVLIDVDRSDDAVAELEPLTDDLRGVVPQFWGGLSIAYLEAGDAANAEEALTEGRAINPSDCRVRIAGTLIAIEDTGEPPDATTLLNIGLSCDPGLNQFFLSLVPEEIRSQIDE